MSIVAAYVLTFTGQSLLYACHSLYCSTQTNRDSAVMHKLHTANTTQGVAGQDSVLCQDAEVVTHQIFYGGKREKGNIQCHWPKG